MKKTNLNEHPKKPHPATQDDLLIPYVEQKQDEKNKLKKQQYKPADDGKPDFASKVPNVQTFSDPSYFNTVFISGDDMVKEMQELKQKEIEDFEKKVVVANKHFSVNTKQGSYQMDKFKSMLNEPV